MTARLRWHHTPEVPDAHVLILDCPHGTTTAVASEADRVLNDAQIIAVAIAVHEGEEACSCARGIGTLARGRRGARA